MPIVKHQINYLLVYVINLLDKTLSTINKALFFLSAANDNKQKLQSLQQYLLVKERDLLDKNILEGKVSSD